jgi:hypothetical protein
LPYFLFTLYFVAFCYFITKIKFLQQSGLGTKTLLLLFSIKVLVGIIGGLVGHYLMHDKTDLHFYTIQGLIEYDNLIHNPKVFFTDSLPSAYANNLGQFFGSSNSFWNDLRNNILLKTIGVFNILSRGNYYINSLFFNFIAFFAHIALYKIFKDVFKNNHWAIIVGCFLLPSTLYYTSLIGKDLIIFTSLAIFCYCSYFSWKENFTVKRIVFLVLSFFCILLIRNFIAVVLFPCVLGWFISRKYSFKVWKVYLAMTVMVLAGIFAVQFTNQKYNPLQIVVAKQQAFFALGKAHSEYQNDTLQSNIKSFINAAPTALRHAFLSPYPTEFDNIYLNGFALEIITYLLLFFLMIIFPLKNNIISKDFIFFTVIFTALIFLFTGYITTNAGALVRYRSIYFPFLIVPILCSINWKRINSFIKQSKSTKA